MSRARNVGAAPRQAVPGPQVRGRNIPLAIELAEAGVDCPCIIAEASGISHSTATSIIDAVAGEYEGAMRFATYSGLTLADVSVSP